MPVHAATLSAKSNEAASVQNFVPGLMKSQAPELWAKRFRQMGPSEELAGLMGPAKD